MRRLQWRTLKKGNYKKVKKPLKTQRPNYSFLTCLPADRFLITLPIHTR